MIFTEKTIKLKDGALCVFRSPKTEDAGEMLEYLKTCAQETEFILRYPEECTETVEEEAQYLNAINESPYNLMIGATVNGKIVGNAQIAFKKRFKVCHRASIGIGIIKAYWNRGIGTALLSDLIEIGKARGVEQIELEVVSGNERAISLYQKMGFQIIGTIPKGIKLKNGSYFDEYIMILDLTGKE
ncbi:MAG: GNAT family N-acetyltransferase [Bacilli bacterium]|nr:GNAT family N-acetyltransferase [Bacilli bacterium]HHU24932.1 GNAT family N-acetyltransferase [Acholeplasmataceae bacterium]